MHIRTQQNEEQEKVTVHTAVSQGQRGATSE